MFTPAVEVRLREIRRIFTSGMGARRFDGEPAPPLDLPTPDGSRRSLGEFLGRPVMVSFLGPANCLFCRAHVIRVISAKEEWTRRGADVIFVAFHDPDLVMSKMMHDLDLPY